MEESRAIYRDGTFARAWGGPSLLLRSQHRSFTSRSVRSSGFSFSSRSWDVQPPGICSQRCGARAFAPELTPAKTTKGTKTFYIVGFPLPSLREAVIYLSCASDTNLPSPTATSEGLRAERRRRRGPVRHPATGQASLPPRSRFNMSQS